MLKKIREAGFIAGNELSNFLQKISGILSVPAQKKICSIPYYQKNIRITINFGDRGSGDNLASVSVNELSLVHSSWMHSQKNHDPMGRSDVIRTI